MLGLSYESVDKVGKPFQEKGTVCTKAQRLTGTILAGFQAECSVKVWMRLQRAFPILPKGSKQQRATKSCNQGIYAANVH